MQTFLPYPDIMKSIECLDNRRLGKQRVETWQILDILTKLENSKSWQWRNHPVVKMWLGFVPLLTSYYNYNLFIWERRGFQNDKLTFTICETEINYPNWFGKEEFHASHRAALLAKNFAYYSKFGWKEKPKIEYYWPNK